MYEELEAHRRSLLSHCYSYLGNWADAEDAVQETFVKAVGTGESPDHVRAWLFRIARNHCLNVRRNVRRRKDCRPLASDSRLAGDTTGCLTRLVKQETRARVADVVATLPEPDREILRLRYGDESFSRDELAYILDLPVSVVKSRIFEALQRLRDHTSLGGTG